jgi:hypothetical protein
MKVQSIDRQIRHPCQLNRQHRPSVIAVVLSPMRIRYLSSNFIGVPIGLEGIEKTTILLD